MRFGEFLAIMTAKPAHSPLRQGFNRKLRKVGSFENRLIKQPKTGRVN